MLGFFPTPYPDELLYSTIARYHLRSGNLSPKCTLQELFNTRHAIATADLPCHLEALTTNLSPISDKPVEEWIQHHTLYPFYAPFLSQERSQQLRMTMISDKGAGIHDLSGIRASSIQPPKYFRFCPQCIQEDQEIYGELYWHRSHQVPGVLVCAQHGKVLLDSSVPIQGMNRHKYCAASPPHCFNTARSPNFSDETLNHYWRLAQDANFLLTHSLPSRNYPLRKST